MSTVKWHLIDPNGETKAIEQTCVKALARIDGYKPTLESMLAYEEAGWQVVPICSMGEVGTVHEAA